MNVLFYFVSQINPRSGGTERVTDTVAHKLRERGHVVYYMSRTKLRGTMIYLVSFCLINMVLQHRILPISIDFVATSKLMLL